MYVKVGVVALTIGVVLTYLDCRPSTMSGTLEQRLQTAQHQISQIRSFTGNAGLSVGILHHSQVIYRAHFGYCDIASKKVADSDTQYHIASMSKAFTSACLAILVDEEKLSWTSPLHKLIPEFASPDFEMLLPQLRKEANVVDIMSHRLGLTQRNMFRLQGQGKLLMQAKDTVAVVASLKPVREFRTKMTYNDWTFALSGTIVHNITGKSIGTMVKALLLDPLGLKRTTMGAHSLKNHVTSYMAFSNATPCEVPPPPFEDEKLQTSTTAVKSSINDLLIFYKALLSAGSDQLASKKSRTAGSPFRRVTDMWESHSDIDGDSSYGMGWVLANIPGKGGLVGMNSYESDKLPIIGKGTKQQRMIYHQGSINGALSAVYLLPETGTVIVVLSNSLDLGDTPDWVAQLVLEILLDSHEPNDYVELARKTALNCINHQHETNKKLADERLANTTSKSLAEYTGKYRSQVNDFSVYITAHGGGLRMTVQGFETVRYDMYHYHNDVFAWDCDRDAQTKEAMWPISVSGFYKIAFGSDQKGNITDLRWALDKNVPEGELFIKKSAERL